MDARSRFQLLESSARLIGGPRSSYPPGPVGVNFFSRLQLSTSSARLAGGPRSSYPPRRSSRNPPRSAGPLGVNCLFLPQSSDASARLGPSSSMSRPRGPLPSSSRSPNPPRRSPYPPRSPRSNPPRRSSLLNPPPNLSAPPPRPPYPPLPPYSSSPSGLSSRGAVGSDIMSRWSSIFCLISDDRELEVRSPGLYDGLLSLIAWKAPSETVVFAFCFFFDTLTCAASLKEGKSSSGPPPPPPEVTSSADGAFLPQGLEVGAAAGAPPIDGKSSLSATGSRAGSSSAA